MRFQWHVVSAVFWRNFKSYFYNPIGYLFITAFVFVSGYYAFCFDGAFFASNIADLSQLNKWFPYLLLFFVPAITMTAWAEERKTGTDELLLTLPASDLEIVVGKYLSCLAIYTVALLFSCSHIIILWSLGRPDFGLMFSTYLGYWLVGAALLSAGMVASLLSSNVTIAFIWGVLICLSLVAFSRIGSLITTSDFAREGISNIGVVPYFAPFGDGELSLPSVFFFLSVIVVMLYLNMVLLSRRHWAGSQQSANKWGHYLMRAAAIAMAAISLTILANDRRSYLRVDLTEEKLHKLSPDTVKILNEIDPKRPVLIEAFISPKVPREYVETKRDLEERLRDFEANGGSRVVVRIHNTELYSQDARDAERVYEIRPEVVATQEESRYGRESVFLGVAFKCGLNEKTIPFVYRGLPVEYELTRMIRTVSEKAKRKIGVLTTDAALFGSFNFQSMQPGRDWLIVEDLKQQYDVVQISPDTPIAEKIDALIVPMASSLTQTQLNNLTDYVKGGGPTLIFDDPMPLVNPRLAAREQKAPERNPMFGGGAPPMPKGNLRDLMNLLNIEFDTGTVVSQLWNPHRQFDRLPPEYVFVGDGSGNREAFNPNESVSAGLQEAVLIYPGAIRPKGGDGPKVTPLLTTNDRTATVRWNGIFTDSFLGRMLNERPDRRVSGSEFVLAAYVHGKFADNAASKGVDKDAEGKDKKPAEAKDAKVIFICDLDMVSDAFFSLRRAQSEGEERLNFDNVTFVLNCVDFLAGDTSFVDLRKKRSKRRNLETLDRMIRNIDAQAARQKEKTEEETQAALKKAQAVLDDTVKKIRDRKDIDPRTKQVLVENAQQTEQRRLEVTSDKLKREAEAKDRQYEADARLAIRMEQNRIQLAALLIPPIPALVIGIMVYFRRRAEEKEGVDAKRLI